MQALALLVLIVLVYWIVSTILAIVNALIGIIFMLVGAILIVLYIKKTLT